MLKSFPNGRPFALRARVSTVSTEGWRRVSTDGAELRRRRKLFRVVGYWVCGYPVDTGAKAKTSELLREALRPAPIVAKFRVRPVDRATAPLAIDPVNRGIHRGATGVNGRGFLQLELRSDQSFDAARFATAGERIERRGKCHDPH